MNEKRLIDANALGASVSGIGKDIKRPRAVELACLVLINEAPTVDAMEVVHGRWIAVSSSDMMTGKAYKCSECNKMRYGSFLPNYCSNCGAKMDGERKNDGM